MVSSSRNEPPAIDVQSAWAAEQLLLSDDVRHDAEALTRLLALDFHEIGQSGKHWTRAETIDALVAAPTSDSSFTIDERRVNRLGDGTVLLTYRLNIGGQRSRRSSVWRLTDTGPELVFHQGTVSD